MYRPLSELRTALLIPLVATLLATPPTMAESSAGSTPEARVTQSSYQRAARLIADLRVELAEVEDEIRHHPFLDALENGDVSSETLRGFATEEYYIIQSDLRSQALLTSRFGATPSGDFFNGLLTGERIAFDLIRRFGAAVDLDETDLVEREPRAGGQAFPNAVAAMAAFRSEAEAAAAFLLNFGVFGENTARMAVALQEVYGFTAHDVEFFTFFGTPIPGFEEAALEVIAAGLDKGVEPRDIERAARLLQEYELEFWDTVAEAP